MKGQPQATDPAIMDAEKEHIASASIAVMTHSGTQAELDFFDLPSTEIFLSQKYNDARRLEITPVLRVYTTSGILESILDRSSEIAKTVEPDVNALLNLTPVEENP